MQQWVEYTERATKRKACFDFARVEALKANEYDGTDIGMRSGVAIYAMEPLSYFIEFAEDEATLS